MEKFKFNQADLRLAVRKKFGRFRLWRLVAADTFFAVLVTSFGLSLLIPATMFIFPNLVWTRNVFFVVGFTIFVFTAVVGLVSAKVARKQLLYSACFPKGSDYMNLENTVLEKFSVDSDRTDSVVLREKFFEMASNIIASPENIVAENVSPDDTVALMQGVEGLSDAANFRQLFQHDEASLLTYLDLLGPLSDRKRIWKSLWQVLFGDYPPSFNRSRNRDVEMVSQLEVMFAYAAGVEFDDGYIEQCYAFKFGAAPLVFYPANVRHRKLVRRFYRPFLASSQAVARADKIALRVKEERTARLLALAPVSDDNITCLASVLKSSSDATGSSLSDVSNSGSSKQASA